MGPRVLTGQLDFILQTAQLLACCHGEVRPAGRVVQGVVAASPRRVGRSRGKREIGAPEGRRVDLEGKVGRVAVSGVGELGPLIGEIDVSGFG